MEKTLLIQARLLDDRYHGHGDWPPSPARLYQALIAGNAIGARLPTDCTAALRWLEALPPPEIRSQRGRLGLPYTSFVPNNDLDAKGGNPARVADIRVGKTIRPRHLDARRPILYLWRFQASAAADSAADQLCAMAGNLYQLGRGLDMAWAQAEVMDTATAVQAVAAFPGDIFRPGERYGEVTLDCPQPGSLDSLITRFQAQRMRLRSVQEGRKVKVYFTNPPKAQFKPVDYNPAERWRLFELRAQRDGSPLHSWPQHRAVALVEQVRDRIAERLTNALEGQGDLIERVIIGRHATKTGKAIRIQLIPLPSIGAKYTNRSIRRLLLKVPADCPLAIDDIEWALSGLSIGAQGAEKATLVAASDLGMLRHYGLETGDRYRTWRSVTPLALPISAGRRRIDPQRRLKEAKGGAERSEEEQRACAAVIQALRHAGLRGHVETVRVQREPFSDRGIRAEAFAADTRFPKERLWHIELVFAEPREGLIILGDGRYLGLGLMAPDPDAVTGVWAYDIIAGLEGNPKPESLTRSLRRAVMARVQAQMGPNRQLPGFFTGHEADGRALRRGSHGHLAFAFDPVAHRLFIIAPHRLGLRHVQRGERGHLERLDIALQDFTQLRAGPAGLLRLARTAPTTTDSPILARARTWESLTPYQPTRHAKRLPPAEALREDVLAEIRRLQLPIPEVRILSVHKGPRGGLEGHLRLDFPTVQCGPILLGRTRHFGGGLFRPVPIQGDAE